MFAWRITRLKSHAEKTVPRGKLDTNIQPHTESGTAVQIYGDCNEPMHLDVKITFQCLHQKHWKMLTTSSTKNKASCFDYSVIQTVFVHICATCFHYMLRRIFHFLLNFFLRCLFHFFSYFTSIAYDTRSQSFGNWWRRKEVDCYMCVVPKQSFQSIQFRFDWSLRATHTTSLPTEFKN